MMVKTRLLLYDERNGELYHCLLLARGSGKLTYLQLTPGSKPQVLENNDNRLRILAYPNRKGGYTAWLSVLYKYLNATLKCQYDTTLKTLRSAIGDYFSCNGEVCRDKDSLEIIIREYEDCYLLAVYSERYGKVRIMLDDIATKKDALAIAKDIVDFFDETFENITVNQTRAVSIKGIAYRKKEH